MWFHVSAISGLGPFSGQFPILYMATSITSVSTEILSRELLSWEWGVRSRSSHDLGKQQDNGLEPKSLASWAFDDSYAMRLGCAPSVEHSSDDSKQCT